MKKESKKRINLEHVLDEYMKSGGDGHTEIEPVRHHIPYLVVALEKCYARENELIEALKIIRDDLDDALETKGYNTLAHEKSEKTLQKIRNFANDASQ